MVMLRIISGMLSRIMNLFIRRVSRGFLVGSLGGCGLRSLSRCLIRLRILIVGLINFSFIVFIIIL